MVASLRDLSIPRRLCRRGCAERHPRARRLRREPPGALDSFRLTAPSL